MSISNKHNHKTFTKSPPASLLHCIENILNHLFGKCRNFLTSMAALSFTKSTGLCTKFIQLYHLSNSVFLFVFHLIKAFGTAKGFVYLITK